jgi:site-specific DNA-adenine methylase
MTSYHGGKQRIGKKLANIIYQECLDQKFVPEFYYEGFMGMLGVYKYIVPLFNQFEPIPKYIASDINKSLVLMWKKVQKGWVPPTKVFTADEFLKLKSQTKSSALKGYVGHFYGYMGQYFVPFKSYHSEKEAKNQSDKIVKMGKEFEHVKFFNAIYDDFSHLRNGVLYMDPPYEEHSCYYQEAGKAQTKMDYDHFWQWCREMAKTNLVFISGYSAPSDFIKIFEIQSRTPKSPRTEILFLAPR